MLIYGRMRHLTGDQRKLWILWNGLLCELYLVSNFSRITLADIRLREFHVYWKVLLLKSYSAQIPENYPSAVTCDGMKNSQVSKNRSIFSAEWKIQSTLSAWVFSILKNEQEMRKIKHNYIDLMEHTHLSGKLNLMPSLVGNFLPYIFLCLFKSQKNYLQYLTLCFPWASIWNSMLFLHDFISRSF